MSAKSLLIPGFYDYNNHVHPRKVTTHKPAFSLPIAKDKWIGHSTFEGCIIRRITVTIPNAQADMNYSVDVGKWVAGEHYFRLDVATTFELKPWNNSSLVYITEEINWSSPKLNGMQKIGFCVRAGLEYTSDYYFECNARYSAGLDFIAACVLDAPSAKDDEVVYSTHHDIELKNGQVPHLITAYVAYNNTTPGSA